MYLSKRVAQQQNSRPESQGKGAYNCVCQAVQAVLIQTCDTIVNDDGVINTRRDRTGNN